MKKIETHGIEAKPVFGGVIIEVNGVKVEQTKHGFKIAIGLPGFNSLANNRWGYKTAEAAAAACHRYNSK